MNLQIISKLEKEYKLSGYTVDMFQEQDDNRWGDELMERGNEMRAEAKSGW